VEFGREKSKMFRAANPPFFPVPGDTVLLKIIANLPIKRMSFKSIDYLWRMRRRVCL
jgi:hypothetical protein